MYFSEHGIFEVKVEDKCMLVDATGPFNEELTSRYRSAIESSIQRLESNDWTQIIVLHNMSLFTPEAEELLIKTLVNRKERGLTKSAIVLIDAEGKALITQQMSRIYKTAQVDYRFFSSIEQAKVWCTQQKLTASV